jgi:hypothetical protein
VDNQAQIEPYNDGRDYHGQHSAHAIICVHEDCGQEATNHVEEVVGQDCLEP